MNVDRNFSQNFSSFQFVRDLEAPREPRWKTQRRKHQTAFEYIFERPREIDFMYLTMSCGDDHKDGGENINIYLPAKHEMESY